MFAQVVFSIIGAVLSVVLTKIFIQNGKYIRNLVDSVEEGKKETRQMLVKMSEGLEKMSEGTERIMGKMSQELGKIADLIAVEAKGIKQEIKAAK